MRLKPSWLYTQVNLIDSSSSLIVLAHPSQETHRIYKSSGAHTQTHTQTVSSVNTQRRAGSLWASVWAAVLNVWTGNFTWCHFKQCTQQPTPNSCHLYLSEFVRRAAFIGWGQSGAVTSGALEVFVYSRKLKTCGETKCKNRRGRGDKEQNIKRE